MEAQPEALERHWDKIREFLESELFRRGDSKVWIDTVGPQGYPVVTTSYMLKELVESGEPPRRALVIPEKHESIISIREFFGRRPVRVRRYRRRH